ncbi:MAG: RDD family protein, partial [Dehalococcoidia bacterium]|nr:RDD family protein [Dehalococcoidia bacterium]
MATDESPSEATIVLASRGLRLSGHVLEMALFGLTLGVGWAFWFASTGRDGQTPAKRLLGMRVVDATG